MKRTVVLAGILALSLLGGARAADTVSLGYKEDTGPNPSVFFVPETVDRAISFNVTFSASPAQLLGINYAIDCTRGPKSVADRAEAEVMPPYSVTIPATLADAESCWVSLSAEPPCCDGEDDPGSIRIEATATRRPYWGRCRAPRWLAQGSLRIHGYLTCKAADRIASSAWHRSEKAGHYLSVGSYFCVRSGRGNQVAVRCDHDSDRLKLSGQLRD